MELNKLTLLNDSNLVAHYRMESGGLTTDSKGSYPLSNNNSVGSGVGKYGGGADFGASNTTKFFDIADYLGLSNYQTGVFSVSSWVNLAASPSSGENQCVFGLVRQTEAQTNFSYANSSGTYQFQYTNYNGSTAETLTFDNTLSTNAWNHLVFVKNGTTVSVYVNGTKVADKTITIANGSPNRSSQFTLGRNAYDNANYWKGLMDDVAVFNRALTAAEILQIYKEQLSAWFMFM